MAIRPLITAAALWLAMMASACGNTTTAPTPPPATIPAPTSPAPPRPHTFVTLRLSGTVRDDQGAPVPGATITLTGIESPVSASTDAAGFYTTSASVDTFYAPPLAWVSIKRSGYEDLDNAAIFTGLQDTTANFVTFRRTPIPGGTEVTLGVAFNGPLCGFDLEYPCRHVLVSAPAAGTLVLETTANASGSYFFGPISYPVAGVTRRSLAVTAGETVPVEILWNAAPMPFTPDRSATFRLTTSLQP